MGELHISNREQQAEAASYVASFAIEAMAPCATRGSVCWQD